MFDLLFNLFILLEKNMVNGKNTSSTAKPMINSKTVLFSPNEPQDTSGLKHLFCGSLGITVGIGTAALGAGDKVPAAAGAATAACEGLINTMGSFLKKTN
jgi:hypothetical protein